MAKQSHFGKLHEIPILKTFTLLKKTLFWNLFFFQKQSLSTQSTKNPYQPHPLRSAEVKIYLNFKYCVLP